MTLNCVPHQVRAGRTVYLLEERTEIAGDGADGPVVRALIALDADDVDSVYVYATVDQYADGIIGTGAR